MTQCRSGKCNNTTEMTQCRLGKCNNNTTEMTQCRSGKCNNTTEMTQCRSGKCNNTTEMTQCRSGKCNKTTEMTQCRSGTSNNTKGAGGRLLKQDDVIKKLQRTGLTIFKHCCMHKYQHPLMVSPKRWCNEAACFTDCFNGPVANLMGDKKTAMTKIITLDSYLQAEMQYFIRHGMFTPDEQLVYLCTRVTYWLFHQLMKGTESCLTWSGQWARNLYENDIQSIARHSGQVCIFK